MADGQQHSTKADRVEREAAAAVKFSALKVTEGSSVCADEVKLQLPAPLGSASFRFPLLLLSESVRPAKLLSRASWRSYTDAENL